MREREQLARGTELDVHNARGARAVAFPRRGHAEGSEEHRAAVDGLRSDPQASRRHLSMFWDRIVSGTSTERALARHGIKPAPQAAEHAPAARLDAVKHRRQALETRLRALGEDGAERSNDAAPGPSRLTRPDVARRAGHRRAGERASRRARHRTRPP